ncbi:SRPBCC family protein [Streptomyces zingiberis]|uniref:SRPBCC domain-containing protein n=1 Tax=Streptomyces zingiberis TaxID=2053010 RepID=A0ABX1BS18_9ACTN|nr:SRPBCC domain-containing protein [Streptomyces zingiberis]NJQ00496.1 SRPBCC domain-containing protein [Streptomyces zingiberis]
MSSERTPADDGLSYTLTRVLDVPVAQVWRAWTTPEQYARWAYAVPGSVEMDVRPGGAWKATMAAPDGQQFPLTGSYLEAEENRRLVIGMDVPGRPEPSTMALELAELGAPDGDRTQVVLSQTCDTVAERQAAEEGSTMLLDSLTTHLTGQPAG